MSHDHRRSAKTFSRSKKAGSSAVSPVVIIDKDPYDFIDSQSLQPDTQPPTRLRTDVSGLQQTTLHDSIKPSTPMSSVSRARSRTPSSRMTKKSPRTLSEAEKLEQKEELQFQKALEASLHEKEMEDRKRRRRHREETREREEQERIMLQVREKQTKLNPLTESVGGVRDLSEDDWNESPETASATEDKDLTQPLPTTPTIAGSSVPKRVKVSVKKLNIGSLRLKKANQILSESEASATETDECGFVDRDSAAVTRRRNRPLRDDSTPPLSEEESHNSQKVAQSTSVAPAPEKDAGSAASVKETYLLGKSDSLSQEGESSRQSELPMDIATVETLTTSSNLDTNPPSSIAPSMPFKVDSNLEQTPDIPNSQSDFRIPTLNEIAHCSTLLPESTELLDSPIRQTAVKEPSQTSTKSKLRSGGLSLSRNKRKRSSPQRIIFEEIPSPIKVPPAKRARSVDTMSPVEITELLHSDSGSVEEVKQSVVDGTNPASVSEPKQMDCSVEGKHLGECEKSNDSIKSTLNPVESPCDHALQTASITDTSHSPQPISAKTKSTSTSTLPQQNISRPSTKPDLHTLNPSLPLMFCPQGTSPKEYTPLIIQRFDSYFAQLREIQSKVLTRLKWGEPVKMASSRQLNLDCGRKTRRLRNTDKIAHSSLLVLSKRKALSTQDTSESVSTEQPESKFFSLSSDSEEDRNLPSQQSLGSQKASKHTPSHTDDHMEVETARNLASPETRPQPDPPKAPISVDETYDDLILLDTQLDKQTHTPTATPAKKPTQASTTSSLHSSALSHRSTVSRGSQSPSVQPGLVERDHGRSTSHSKSPQPLTWLNSRVSDMSSKSAKTPKRRSTASKKTLRTRSAKKPKSAAARMILEFSHNSDSDFVSDRANVTDDSSPSKNSPPPHFDDSEEECATRRRRTSVKGNRRQLSSSSGSEAESLQEERRGFHGDPSTSSGVIDLTEDTQHTSPPPHTPTTSHHSQQLSPSHTPTPRRLRGRSSQFSTCPICSREYPFSVIQIHASQCEGAMDSSPKSFRTKQSASRGKKLNRRSYQPTLHELQRKEREMAARAGEDIDSASESDVEMEAEEDGGNPLLDELSTALENDDVTHGDERGRSPSPPSVVETRLIPSEDGGFIVDDSTLSNSPIRTFTKISEMGVKDRERFRNQFKPRALPKKRAGASSTAWSNDFGDLAQSGKAPRGRSRQQGRGNSWSRKRGKPKGRGRYSKRRPRN